MAGTDLALDPTDGDFVDDDAGGWVETATIEPQVRHQVLDQVGLWWADVLAGSAVHAIRRKLNRNTFALYEDAYRDCLRVFVEAGVAEDVHVEIVSTDRNRLDWEASLIDSASGTELDITPLLSFGLEP
jgi:phage gp46-like protein